MSADFFQGWVLGTGVTVFSVALARQKFALAASLFFMFAGVYVLAGAFRSPLPRKDR